MDLEKILEKYDYVIKAVANRYGGKRYGFEPEDLAQECRVRIIEKIGLVGKDNIKNLEAFIRTLCNNCCKNYLRDEKRKWGGNIVYLEEINWRGNEETVDLEDKSGGEQDPYSNGE